ncbi:MAG: hypothetical protein ACLP66_10340 [Polyangia bacterium]
MNARAILTDARDRGIKVTVDGDKLVLEGDITPELVASFKANKPEILKLLAAVPASGPVAVPVIMAQPARSASATPDIMDQALGVVCDDCGRECTVTLVTDYGARYCRECVFPSATRRVKSCSK